MDKILTFTELRVWQEGHRLVLSVYRMVEIFPKKELYGLNSQISRASVSVTSNIAEGFARRTYKDKLRFYYMALGSLVEVQNQLLIARDVGYIGNDLFQEVSQQTVVVHKLLNAFIAKTKSYL